MTYRKLGIAEDCECAFSIMHDGFTAADGMLEQLLAEFGGADKMPSEVRISDDNPKGWHGAEQAIAIAEKRGNWPCLCDLMDSYLKRVEAFCDRSRAKFLTKESA